MKIYFVAAFILFLNSAFAQVKIEIDPGTSKYSTKDVIQFDSISKGFLFNKTKEWIALHYKSSKDVIQLESQETGKIITKGSFGTTMYMKDGYIDHTITFDFKDNRIRYTYSDFSYYSAGSGKMTFESSIMGKKGLIKSTEERIRKSIAELTNYINNNSKDSDW